MGGWRQIFKLLASEDVKSGKMDLCVAVLSRLRSRHVHNLARPAFDDNETILSQCRALLRISRGRTGIGAVEGVLMLYKRPVSHILAERCAKSDRTVRGKLEVSYLRVVRHDARAACKVVKK